MTRAIPRVALEWIVRLRYFMAAGQIATALLVDLLLGIDLPLGWMILPPSVIVLSNLWLARRHGSADLTDSRLINGIFALDTLCLTAVLMLSGGPNNPFSLLYLVNITLSATILTRRQTWGLGVLATACFGLLFWAYRPIPALEMHQHGEGVNLHLLGMWFGFAIACLLITMFSGKISEQLRERDESLLRMQEALAKKERLASLVTLAAGAAHELNTPLGTIAVVAKELERYATLAARDGAVAEDSRLIRTEVERCRTILRRMSVEGAEPTGEALERVSIPALLATVSNLFASSGRLEVETVALSQDAALVIPRHAVEQALAALIKNALEASPGDSQIRIRVEEDPGLVRFVVKDSGSGMSEETIRHAGEPFYTTKDPGKGMGLGIFLVRTLADRLGGKLTFESRAGVGTTAVFELPMNVTLAGAGK